MKLSLGKEHLRLSVVKPKQKGLSNDSEPLQLNNVLACKLQKFGEVNLFYECLRDRFSLYSARCLIGSRIIESAAYCIVIK